jgi:hypothetical protein
VAVDAYLAPCRFGAETRDRVMFDLDQSRGTGLGLRQAAAHNLWQGAVPAAKQPIGPAECWRRAAGVGLRSVQRILEAHQLAPHRIRTFKLSNDPKFAELKNIVGL